MKRFEGIKKAVVIMLSMMILFSSSPAIMFAEDGGSQETMSSQSVEKENKGEEKAEKKEEKKEAKKEEPAPVKEKEEKKSEAAAANDEKQSEANDAKSEKQVKANEAKEEKKEADNDTGNPSASEKSSDADDPSGANADKNDGSEENENDPSSGAGSDTVTEDATSLDTVSDANDEEAAEEEADEDASDEDEDKEEQEYPAQSFSGETSELRVRASVDKGVFPEGTSMRVGSVSKQVAIDAAEKISGADAEVVDAIAADITFHHEGSEIQPKGNVRVSLSAKRSVKGESHDAITIDDRGHADVVADASATSAAFSTDHFTVYGIVGTEYTDDDDVKHYVRRIYEFYAGDPETQDTHQGWVKVDEQIVKDGDTLDKPEDPAGSSKHPFDKWVDESGTPVNFNTPVTIDPATIEEGAAKADDLQIVKLYASYKRLYKVTLYTDEACDTVYETNLFNDGEAVKLPGAADIDKERLLVEDGKVFTGWIDAAKQADGTVSSFTVTVNGADIDLYPDFKKGYKVTFVTDTASVAGVSAWFDGRELPSLDVPVQYVAEGDKASRPAEPAKGALYAGYRFGGWYQKYKNNDDECLEFSDPWDFDNNTVKDEDVTLYAKWDLEDITAGIVYYRNASAYGDNDNFTPWVTMDSTRTFRITPGESVSDYKTKVLAWYKSQKLNGASGVHDRDGNGVDNSTKHYHLSGQSAVGDDNDHAAIEVLQDGKIIAAYDANTDSWNTDAIFGTTGDVEFRVYLCRNTYTMKVRYEYGYYSRYEGTVSGMNYGGQIADIYKDYLPNAQDISGLNFTVRHRENLQSTIYPTLRDTYGLVDGTVDFRRFYTSSGGQQTFENNPNYYLRNDETVRDGDTIFLLVRARKSEYPHEFIYRYYNPDGTLNEEESYSRTIKYAEKNHKHEFNVGTAVNGYKFTSVTYDAAGNQTADSVIEKGKTKYIFRYQNGNAQPLYLHHYPVQYKVTFDPQDGERPITAQNTKWQDNAAVTDKSAFYNSEDISYTVQQDPVSAYGAGQIKQIGGLYKRFDGWYDNREGKGEPFHFDGAVIEGANRTFYGKWTPVDVTVVFHPDNNTDYTEQKVLLGYTATRIANPERDDAVFGGWYLDEAHKKPYDFGTVLDEQKVQELADAEGKIHLYALWNSKQPYTVVYDANGGEIPEAMKTVYLNNANEDRIKYRAGSNAAAKVVAEKDGEVFVGWAIGTEKGSLIENGQSFKINATNDEADGKEDEIIKLVAVYIPANRATTVVYHSNFPERGPDWQVTVPQETVNGTFTVMDPSDSLLQFGTVYTVGDSLYEFVCWTSRKGEWIFTDDSSREYFYPEEQAAAGQDENRLYAVWRVLDKVVVKEVISITVNKKWEDMYNVDDIRPESVTIQLLADGTPVSDAALTLSEENNWSGMFENLPKTSLENLTEIEIAYTVEEVNVPEGYTVNYSGNATDGFTVTNTHISLPPITPEPPTPPVPPVPPVPPTPPEQEPEPEIIPDEPEEDEEVLGDFEDDREDEEEEEVLGDFEDDREDGDKGNKNDKNVTAASSGGVKTGDDLPIGLLTVLGASLLAFVIMIVLKLRRRSQE